MKISIITVCYNSENTIRDTIESLLSQDYTDIEYIIIDGGSSDRTLEIIDGYRGYIASVVSEADKGLYDAMNKGIAIATGDVIGILNSDDFYESNDVISAIADEFIKSPKIDMVFGDIVFVKPKNLSVISRYYYAGHFRPWKLRFGWMPPHPGTFVRRSLYQKTGFYSLDYKIAADYEMFVRWLVTGQAHYKWIDKILVRMRTGGTSTAGFKQSILLNREIVRACRYNNLYTNLFFVLSKIPMKLLELLRRPENFSQKI